MCATTAHVKGGQGEARALPRVQFEIGRAPEVQSAVENWEGTRMRTLVLRLPLELRRPIIRSRPDDTQGYVVVRVKPGERLALPVCCIARCSQVASHQAISVEVVETEEIYIQRQAVE